MMTDAGRQRAERRFQLQLEANRREGLLNVKEVCTRLRCGNTKFYASIITQPSFPRPVLIGARKLWRADEVDAWSLTQRI
ncbi:helix-turn-helix transcriptional regulator [Sphingomonas beigongshangi]|uniref:helix-turn-helix transcriptional regulator n=1 Tax=Sphingomonas beigongshangi TaxID=2782540 RepID=UPI00193B7DC3|nr:AlpA family phage regulatory protein [Sphingomonas beigongshangi]